MTLGKIETYLLSQGYQIYSFKGTKWDLFEGNAYYSTMGNVHYQFRKGPLRFQLGLNEVGKPPTLLYPRPKGIRNDDEMNAFIDSHSAEEIVSIILGQQSKI